MHESPARRPPPFEHAALTAWAMNFRNTYLALRHGRSTANEAGIIVSDPLRGVPDFGLSAAGRADLGSRLAGSSLAARGLSGASTQCYSSDFRRARETAELFCSVLGLPAPVLTAALRERSFGDLEGQSHERYAEVWRADAHSEESHLFGSESAAEVAARLLEFLRDCEVSHAGQTIIAVAHGDTLQIMQTIFRGIACNRHRELPHLEPGELRWLS